MSGSPPSEDVAAPSEDRPSGIDTWKQETKGIERVIDVMLTIEEPQTAGSIAGEAHISEQTAREHLELFAELGVLTATTGSGITRYQPDPAWLRFQELSQLTEQYDRDELLDQVEELKERIGVTESRFGVTSPNALRAKAAADDTTADDVKEFRTAASEWESALYDLQVRQQALERYDEFDRTTVTG
jgi:hypothetical protein